MSILNRPGWVNQITVNEARSSRHAGSLDLSIVQKQLADKKIGIPYRDARRFLFDFLRDRGIVDGTTPQAAKDINAIIGALVTSGKITPEVSNEWNAYIADISNLQQFIGSTRTVRGRLANDASENVPATPDEIKKRMEDRKFERKLGSATSQLADIEGFDEYKLIKINVLKNMLSKAEQNDELAENPKFVKCVEYISNLVEVSTSPEDLESKLNKIIDETENNEIIVLCEPELPEGVKIDDDNNIYIEKTINIQTELPSLVLNNDSIIIEIGDQRHHILVSELSMKREQYYKIKNQGITKPNDDICNVSQKSDIIVKIVLV